MWLWVAIIALLAAVGGAVYFFVLRPRMK